MNTLTPSSMSLVSWPSSASSSSLVIGSVTSLNQFANNQIMMQNNQANETSRPHRPIKASHNFKPQKSNSGSFNNTFMLTPHIATTLTNAKYSRKVFVGGLPQDIDQDEIFNYFRVYGQLTVDWPHKSESKSVYPPKGYVFLIFEKEKSVQDLMSNCAQDKDKYYLNISSASVKDKQIQIRPWCLNDTDYVMDTAQPIDPRKTIFVGGVPRPLKSRELAQRMEDLYGGVCYAGIDTDPELKYPKGAARVSFTNQHSYKAAINSRFVLLNYDEIEKRVRFLFSLNFELEESYYLF